MDQTPVGVGSDGVCTGQFVFSPNSQYLAFNDTSDNPTGAPVAPNNPVSSSPPGLSNSGSQPSYVYVRDLAAQATSLVSISTGGMASGNVPNIVEWQGELVFSPDSQSLVFDSTATDLTDNLPNNAPNPDPGSAYQATNLFLRDLSTGTTTLLSVTTDGRLAEGNSGGAVLGANSGFAVFSPDGQDVAFVSTATDLTDNAPDTSSGGSADADPLGNINVFVRDLATGTTTLVSATPGGLRSDGYTTDPVFSPDGIAGLRQQRHRPDQQHAGPQSLAEHHDDYGQHALQHKRHPAESQPPDPHPDRHDRPDPFHSRPPGRHPDRHGQPDPFHELQRLPHQPDDRHDLAGQRHAPGSALERYGPRSRLQPRWALPGLHQQRR